MIAKLRKNIFTSWYYLPHVLVRVLWRNRTNMIHKEMYYEEMIHKITEAEKSQRLPSVS